VLDTNSFVHQSPIYKASTLEEDNVSQASDSLLQEDDEADIDEQVPVK
jgi:hypothetical protein